MFREKICEIFAEGRDFHWYWLKENRVEVVIQEISLSLWVCNSGSIFLQCLDTCGVSFLMFDKSIAFFRDKRNFHQGIYHRWV